MPPLEGLDLLLADLDTLAGIADAAVLSREDLRLEEGETRPAAVLFVDVVGFSELSRQLSTEQLATFVDRTFRIFELTVKSHGGYCDKVIGDAGVYVFCGHPNYAPVCEAALSAGLGILERASQVSGSLSGSGIRLAVRAGVAFGSVTRKRAGGAEAAESVFGEAVNLAQRLESAAEPGTLLTTATVLDRAGDVFETVPLGSRELKGIGSVELMRIDSEHPRLARLRGAFGQLSPLIGRQALIDEGLQRVENWGGASGAVLLVMQGPAAVGKSRLAYEMAKRIPPAGGGDNLCSTAYCQEQSALSALLAEVLGVAGLNGENLPERWPELCRLGASIFGADYAERAAGHLVVLAHLLDCRSIDTSAIRQTSVNAFRLACRVAVHDAMELAGLEGRRQVLVIEDIQWLGDSAEVLSAALAGLRVSPPVVVLATARPEYEHLSGALGAVEGHVLEVSPLGAEAGSGLLEALLPGLELPPAIERELHEKASGLPYYYEEFARMLLSRGIAAPAGGGPPERYVLTREIKELAVPDNVQAMLLGRLDQLPPELKELAMHASVLGHSFKASLLAKLEERITAMAESELQRRLQALTAEHVLVAETGG